MFLCGLVRFGAHSPVLGLLSTLHSIMLLGVHETIWNACEKSQVIYVQGICHICQVITLDFNISAIQLSPGSPAKRDSTVFTYFARPLSKQYVCPASNQFKGCFKLGTQQRWSRLGPLLAMLFWWYSLTLRWVGIDMLGHHLSHTSVLWD